jgi:hypothetical protein
LPCHFPRDVFLAVSVPYGNSFSKPTDGEGDCHWVEKAEQILPSNGIIIIIIIIIMLPIKP